MTISTTIVKNSYSGNGVTTVFNYNFKILSSSDLKVIIRSSTGTETTKTLNTHYTLTGVGSAGGGSITFTAGNIPASAQTVVLIRDTAQTQSIDYVANDPFPAETHEEGLDKGIILTQELQEEIDRCLKLSKTNTINSTEFTIGSTDRANKILAFDANGEIAVTQELGTYRGNWLTATSYTIRDLIKDTSNNNIYYVNTAHTSSGSQPLSSNANTAYYTLIVDAASAASSATASATSAAAALASQNSATSSASTASSSASSASSSASSASSSASSAASSASASAASAASAATSFDDFDDRYLGSKSSAPTLDNDGNALINGALYWNSISAQMFVRDSAAWVAIKPTSVEQTNISTVISNLTAIQNASSNAATATTKASEASTSASNAASSASAASTSASNASTSASAASTSATNSASSASAANASAATASAAQTAVETLFDNFDDRFLGTKTSNPSVDNDGNILSVGAVYYNSVSGQVRFWNGSSWDAPSASAATSATNAASSASSASTSATNAASSASSAATSASNAAASYDSFDDRYLGAKSTAPSLDNDGNTLLTGAIYWNTTFSSLFIWTGSTWDAAAFSASGTVTSFNTRTGSITLSNSDVTTALGLTPISSSSTETLTNKSISGSTNTITNLNASNLSSGTVASARLSLIASDIPSLDASKITTGTIASARLSLTSSDLPTVPTTKGGTGLTTIGTANQYLKVNSGATALEYGTVDLTSLSASNLTSGTVPSARLSSIPNASLANSTITINGSSVSLGGSTTIDAGVFNETIITPTASQTTFATVYTVGYVQVFVNGIKLLNGVDFTATDGTSIVLTSGVQTTDRVEIVKFK